MQLDSFISSVISSLPTEFLDLESKNLHGTVPADFRSLTFLSSLQLHENDLTGVVPVCSASEFLETLTADCSHSNNSKAAWALPCRE